MSKPFLAVEIMDGVSLGRFDSPEAAMRDPKVILAQESGGVIEVHYRPTATRKRRTFP